VTDSVKLTIPKKSPATHRRLRSRTCFRKITVNRPNVDVVVPAFNETAAALNQAIDAVSAQRGVNARLFIVDDASPRPITIDEGHSGNVGLIRLDINAGPSSARNRGAHAGTSEFVAFLDVEVVPPQEWLMRSVAYLQRVPDVGLVTLGTHPAHPTSLLGRWRTAVQEPPQPPQTGPVPWAAGHAIVLRRAVFEALGGFDESKRVGEDVDLSFRIIRRGLAVHYLVDLVCSSTQQDTPEQLAKAEVARFLRGPNLRGRTARTLAVALGRSLLRCAVHAMRWRVVLVIPEMQVLAATTAIIVKSSRHGGGR
jgi:cellulose synthase/poly-beta-1,6-N-acetylglucosamine synthase-like glycosyltransferase